MDNKNYYDTLGVSVKASLDEITSAKNTLAKKYHPDVNLQNGIDTTEQMQEILEAYRILSDQGACGIRPGNKRKNVCHADL